MRLFLIAVLFLAIALESQAATGGQVVLLIAVEYDAKYNQSLTETFETEFSQSDFQTKVIRRAGIKQIRNELLDPQNVAVYLVAHSSSELPQSGLSQSMVIDVDHLRLNEVLQDVHPGLRFLGLVGCNGKSLIERDKILFYPQQTAVFGFDQVVEARDVFLGILGGGLRQAIEASRSVLANNVPVSSTIEPTTTQIVQVTRPQGKCTSSEPGGRWLQVRSGDKVFGILAPEDFSETFKIPSSSLKTGLIVLEYIRFEDLWNRDHSFEGYQVTLDDQPLSMLRDLKGVQIGVNMSLWSVEK